MRSVAVIIFLRIISKGKIDLGPIGRIIQLEGIPLLAVIILLSHNGSQQPRGLKSLLWFLVKKRISSRKAKPYIVQDGMWRTRPETQPVLAAGSKPAEQTGAEKSTFPLFAKLPGLNCHTINAGPGNFCFLKIISHGITAADPCLRRTGRPEFGTYIDVFKTSVQQQALCLCPNRTAKKDNRRNQQTHKLQTMRKGR